MTEPLVKCTVSHGVGTLTLNRPDKLNALSPRMMAELLLAQQSLAGDSHVRVMVVTGAGRGFCAGGDLQEIEDAWKRGDEAGLGEFLDAGKRVVLGFRSAAKPVIAAINGVATGAGFNLALACDFRIAAQETHLGQTFVRLGLHPDFGATWFLPRIVGTARAVELLLTGEMIDAREAARLGIVNRVVPLDQLEQAVKAMAERLAAGPPLVYARTKEAVYRNEAEGLAAAIDFEHRAQMDCIRSDDAREGIGAFLARRAPRFQGR